MNNRKMKIEKIYEDRYLRHLSLLEPDMMMIVFDLDYSDFSVYGKKFLELIFPKSTIDYTLDELKYPEEVKLNLEETNEQITITTDLGYILFIDPNQILKTLEPIQIKDELRELLILLCMNGLFFFYFKGECIAGNEIDSSYLPKPTYRELMKFEEKLKCTEEDTNDFNINNMK